MSRIILYINKKNTLSQLALWMCRSCEVQFNERMVCSPSDMEDIRERNPNSTLPVLQDGDLVLTDIVAILKYISQHSNQHAKWPGLSLKQYPPKELALFEEVASYYSGHLKHTVQSYVKSTQAILYDSVPDPKHKDDVHRALKYLDNTKKGHQFLISNHLTIVDLVVYAGIKVLEHDKQIDWDIAPRIQGWSRVVSKILIDEWMDEKDCLQDYDSEGEEEDYYLAETIMDAVKNDRPDVLEKLGREGANLNMPLAVVEAVNRGNLPCLKVMKDYGGHLKWPMAIAMARRLSKSDDLLTILLDMQGTKEELEAAADVIIEEENQKMRAALGKPKESQEEIQKKLDDLAETRRIQQEQNKPQPTVYCDAQEVAADES